MDVLIVMVLIFASTAIVFNAIKTFYLQTYSTLVATVIAAVTAVMMFAAGGILFYPKNYVRGTNSAEVDLSIINVSALIFVVAVVFYMFKYLPSKEK